MFSKIKIQNFCKNFYNLGRHNFMRINGKNISVVASDFDGTILRDGAMEPSTKFY